MRFGSVCSGIGCLDLGLERAGFDPAWQVEIDPRRRQVLARHWPTVQRFEDLQDVSKRATDLAPVDLLCGGTPCQDWSVAGNRAGLDGDRSQLFVDFIRLADLAAIPWILWENVPGVLSQHGGEDFAICLEGFTGARPDVPPGGWRSAGVAFGPLRWCVWRILDAQSFGVPQRRRRVFVVAGPRDRCRPKILLEPDCLPGDSAEGGAPGEIASTLASTGADGRGWRLSSDDLSQLITSTLTSADVMAGQTGVEGRLVVSPLTTRFGSYDQVGAESQLVTQSLTASSGDRAASGTDPQSGTLVVDRAQITHPENRSNPQAGDPAPALSRSGEPIAYQCHGSNVRPMGTLRTGHNAGDGVPFLAQTLTKSSGKTTDTAGSGGSGPKNLIEGTAGVRRLVPVEYEALQGLPRNWTRWGADGSENKDSPRYRWIGDGAAVPVLKWIGRRLLAAMSSAAPVRSEMAS